jgi:hypothetical protein
MLIFKNNIYSRQGMGLTTLSPTPDIEYDARFNPLHLIEVALKEEDELLDFLERQPKEYGEQDLKILYPRAHKVGGLPVFRNLQRVLISGLENQATWYHMNTYHFCFLYDVLARFAFNYNQDNREGRLDTLPELKGKPLHIKSFVNDYFFDVTFLMDEGKYNSLAHEEKLKIGYKCPCQFGVINGLLPPREEMELQSSRSYPYSIYV